MSSNVDNSTLLSQNVTSVNNSSDKAAELLQTLIRKPMTLIWAQSRQRGSVVAPVTTDADQHQRPSTHASVSVHIALVAVK